MWYFILKNIVLGPLLKVLFRPWIRGADRIPSDGAAILASNHLSFSDSIFLPLMLRRPVVFLAKSEYFTGKRDQRSFIPMVLQINRATSD